jgi:NADPH:quinone reductase
MGGQQCVEGIRNCLVKAIYIERSGAIGDVKASDVPKPSLKEGEVLVKIEASGINPSDIASIQGRFPGAILPRIVGRDFAGRVVGGPPDSLGADVWGTGGDLGISRNGTHAEYVALPESAVARRPKNLSVEQAATAGVPFVTAFSGLVRIGGLKSGEWVIVSGAAGAVGHAAIQLAHARGARVIALVKDEAESAAPILGEVEAIARSDRGDLEDTVRNATGGKGADLALNGVGSSIFHTLLGALAAGGRQVVYSVAGGRDVTLDLLLFYQHQYTISGLNTQGLDATTCAAILREIGPLFESGVIKPLVIGSRYSLDEAANAYGHVASGSPGKTVFLMVA